MIVSDYSAGMLRHKVRITREGTEADGAGAKIPDGAGGYTFRWLPVWEGYVNLGPVSGREAVSAAQLQGTVDGRAVMRFGPAIQSSHRIEYRDRVMNILAPINVEERDRWLVLFYTEGGAT